MDKDIIPYSKPSINNNSLNVKAVIISAAVSVCLYQWTVSAVLFFFVPLFVLVFSNLRKEFIVASVLVVAAAFVSAVTGQVANGDISVERCIGEVVPLLLFLLPANVLFYLKPFRLRFCVLLSGVASGVLIAGLMYFLGTGDLLIETLHEIATQTTEIIPSVYPNIPEINFSGDQIFEMLFAVICRTWLFFFVLFVAMDVSIAYMCCNVMRRRNQQSRLTFVPFANDRVTAVFFIIFAVGAACFEYYASQLFVTAIVWNCALVLSLPAFLAGWSVLLRMMRRRSALLIIAIVVVLSLFISFFSALLYVLCSVAGAVDAWYPLSRDA